MCIEAFAASHNRRAFVQKDFREKAKERERERRERRGRDALLFYFSLSLFSNSLDYELHVIIASEKEIRSHFYEDNENQKELTESVRKIEKEMMLEIW